MSDIDSSDHSLIEDILDEHLPLPTANRGRQHKNSFTRGQDLNSSRGSQSRSSSRECSTSSLAASSSKDTQMQKWGTLSNVQDETPIVCSSSQSQQSSRSSLTNKNPKSSSTPSANIKVIPPNADKDVTLVNSIALLDVDESVKKELLQNLNLSHVRPTVTLDEVEKSTGRKRSGSLGSHGSGSTDSILNEAEEQIRMTESGLDLSEIGRSTGT